MLLRARRVLRLGFASIWRHRLRSALTVLGIVFGVCSVIAMLAIGEGASYEAQEQIKRLGSNNIIVTSRKPPSSESAGEEQTFAIHYGLTYNDAETIRATVPGVDVLVPARTIRSDVIYKRKRVDVDTTGTVPWYPEVANRELVRGRFFNERETRDARNVCVIGGSLRDRLFSLEDPLGKTIRVRGEAFVVIGVMESTARYAERSDAAAPPVVYIPLTTSRARFGDIIMTLSSGNRSTERVELSRFIVRVERQDRVTATAGVLRRLLARTHKQQDYEIVIPLELLRQAERTKQIFSIVLGSIAAISLLVGGIGIMNIMLASVTERTREIGIRRALGARKSDILTQFLTETVLLSSSGGVIGVAVGIAIPYCITRFAEMQTVVQLWALLGAFSMSVITGVVFGIYPAWRAASMNPIAALRHE